MNNMQKENRLIFDLIHFAIKKREIVYKVHIG